MSLSSCKVCNSSSLKIVSHKVYKCTNCEHIFVSYSDDGILFHKELYRKPGHDGVRGNNEVVNGMFTDTFHSRRKLICEKRSTLIEHLYKECDSLLDIGAGGGTFVNLVKKNFNEVEVTEVSDLCVNNLQKNDYKVHHGPFTKMSLGKTYDLVTCWHVLEHVENLDDFLKKVIEVTGKYLVIEVPIKRRLRNPDKDFDGHFHYFSEKSFRLLFEKNFEIVRLGNGVQMPCLFSILKKK